MMQSSREVEDGIRIGVTGHRFLAELDKLKAAVDEALDRIATAFVGRLLVVLSPLAEGADRLVAHAILQCKGSALVVPLPLPIEEYLHDFNSEQSQAEFFSLLKQASRVTKLPATATRNEAYEQVGLYVLDNSDVLIAVYDGQPAQGQGGTAEIVHRALARGIPVLHIKAGNRKAGTNEATTLGEEQGKLAVHNL